MDPALSGKTKDPERSTGAFGPTGPGGPAGPWDPATFQEIAFSQGKHLVGEETILTVPRVVTHAQIFSLGAADRKMESEKSTSDRADIRFILASL